MYGYIIIIIIIFLTGRWNEYTYVRMYVCMYVCTHVRMCVCVCVYVCMYAHNFNTCFALYWASSAAPSNPQLEFQQG